MTRRKKNQKILQISPSDISCAAWSWDDFYRRCVLGERDDPTPPMAWGTFCHSLTELPKDEVEATKYPILPQYKDILANISQSLSEYEKEIAYEREFDIDDWTIRLRYRLDRIHPETGKVIELKFPQKPYTKAKVNADIKNMCYRLFHDDIEVWCATVQNGLEKLPITRTRDQAKEKVVGMLRQIIGRVDKNYF